jgi:uncharacterized protein
MQPKLDIPREALDAWCRRWKVVELAIFGSALRDDFGPQSDVDLLVSFEEDAPWSLFDFVAMQDELEEIFGREVDLVEREGLRNPIRRRAILSTARPLYAAE